MTTAIGDEGDVVARFEIRRHRVLDCDGRAIGKLPPVA